MAQTPTFATTGKPIAPTGAPRSACRRVGMALKPVGQLAARLQEGSQVAVVRRLPLGARALGAAVRLAP